MIYSKVYKVCSTGPLILHGYKSIGGESETLGLSSGVRIEVFSETQDIVESEYVIIKVLYSDGTYGRDKLYMLSRHVRKHYSVGNIEYVSGPHTMDYIPGEEDVDEHGHYKKYSMEVIDIIDEVTINYPIEIVWNIANVIKYIFRAPFKGKMLEDLKKANDYLSRGIEKLEKK